MGHPSDYGDEMDRVHPRLIDAALQGRETGEPALDRAARVVADLRRVLLEEPPSEAAGHLDAMVTAAADGARGSSVLSKRRSGRRRRLSTLPLAAALVLGAGLAWGAVGLPERATETAEEALGAAQERKDAFSKDEEAAGAATEETTHGDEVSAVAKDDSLKGCEKGQAVSAVASSKGNKQGPVHDPCAKGSEAAGQDASAKGKQTAEDARAAAKAKQEAKGDATVEDHGGGPPEGSGPPAGAPGNSGSSAGSGANGNGKP
jgi:hypothetical protein